MISTNSISNVLQGIADAIRERTNETSTYAGDTLDTTIKNLTVANYPINGTVYSNIAANGSIAAGDLISYDGTNIYSATSSSVVVGAAIDDISSGSTGKVYISNKITI